MEDIKKILDTITESYRLMCQEVAESYSQGVDVERLGKEVAKTGLRIMDILFWLRRAVKAEGELQEVYLQMARRRITSFVG